MRGLSNQFFSEPRHLAQTEGAKNDSQHHQVQAAQLNGSIPLGQTRQIIIEERPDEAPSALSPNDGKSNAKERDQYQL